MAGILAGVALLAALVAGVFLGLGSGLLAARAAGLKGGPKALLVLGVVAFGVVAAAFLGIINYSSIKKREAEARAGWNLVPIVVVVDDVPAGTVLTFEHISQRSLPEQFVTRDVAKPDDAHYFVNQRIAVAMKKGDALTWAATCAVTPPSDRSP